MSKCDYDYDFDYDYDIGAKVGEIWITRSGGKAHIFATDGAGVYPILGAVDSPEGKILMRWARNGRSNYLRSNRDMGALRCRYDSNDAQIQAQEGNVEHADES